jgi:hypothetical protein
MSNIVSLQKSRETTDTSHYSLTPHVIIFVTFDNLRLNFRLMVIFNILLRLVRDLFRSSFEHIQPRVTWNHRLKCPVAS